MKVAGAKRQTLFLTGINALVRALGLFLRVILSRMLGAEIMGITELAQSVHMLAITPLTSGLPMAISRMTARAKEADKQKPLLAGLSLVRLASIVMIPLMLLLSPLLSQATGDMRVLPSLWFTAPCILILGYSAAYNGYCYGMEQSRVPAMSELLEQVLRVLFSIGFLYALKKLTAPWLAAVPVAATMLAEVGGLWFVLWVMRMQTGDTRPGRTWRKPVLRLALPTTFTRIVHTLLRSLTAIMIPIRLQATGLSAAESTARLGMLNGMVMPILMLPCIFTSALSMVALPKLAKAEDDLKALRRLLLQCFGSCLPVALLCTAMIYLCAPLLANQVYRMAELDVLFRYSAPLVGLSAFAHLSGGILAALGQQKRTMYGSIVIAVLSLLLTYLWAADPAMRLHGVVLAQMVSQAASILWNLGVLIWWRRERLRPK